MLRILVIDDNPHDRILAIRSLEREFPDLQAKEIVKAEDLASVLETGGFDLVITDYLLRWTDGLTVLRTVKARYPDCPAVMFTNSGTQEIAVEAMKSGLDDYVIKSPQHYVRLAAAVRSVWEKVQTKRKVAGLENRLQGLLNQLNVGVFRLALDGSLLEGNPAFFRLLGLTEGTDARIIQSLEPYFQPEDYAQLLDILKQNGQIRDSQAVLQSTDREVQLQRADGSSIWVRLSKTITTIEGQTIIDGLMEDISDRKGSQEELQNALQKLTFHFENTPLAVIERDRDFRVTRWSPAAERIFGWQEEEVIGSDWQSIHVDDVEAVNTTRARLLSGKEQQNMVTNRSYTKDGSIIDCEWYNSALLDESGNLLSVLSLILDVTERKQAEAERDGLLKLEQAARTEAETANRLKDEFLAVLSHELRSPLNPILGWTKLLRSRKLDEATMSRALETIERNALLQTQLIEDLLDISRIIRGKTSLNICPVNLGSTIEAALETVRLAAQAKSIQIESLIDPTTGMVSGDPNRLQQVVWNLLSNAIKFTSSGGRVTIVLERKGSNAQIQVSDTGNGISADFLPHVFDYFRQADSSTTRTHGGLGLGLAIVRHLVELHGGTVSASSPGLGQGATFTVTLPLKIDRTAASLLQQVQPTVGSTQTLINSAVLEGKRVLVVDDEADTRDYYAMVLEEYGASVTAVASAKDALEALERQRPDVLVSDIGMPYEDGYMLIGKVRALEPHGEKQLPAVALTAYARELDRQQAIAAGFQKHLPKPVEPTDLVAVVAHLVGRTELIEEL